MAGRLVGRDRLEEIHIVCRTGNRDRVGQPAIVDVVRVVRHSGDGSTSLRIRRHFGQCQKRSQPNLRVRIVQNAASKEGLKRYGVPRQDCNGIAAHARD